MLGWGGENDIILTPMVAMQFTKEVNWDETDFIVATIIFGIVGGLIELAVRLSSNWFFRIGALFAALGKHKTSKVCLYINKLGDVDLGVLEKLVALTWDAMNAKYPA